MNYGGKLFAGECRCLRLPNSARRIEKVCAKAVALQYASQDQSWKMKQHYLTHTSYGKKIAKECLRQLLLLTQSALGSQLRRYKSAERHMDKLWLCEVEDIPEKLFQVVVALFSTGEADAHIKLRLTRIREAMSGYDYWMALHYLSAIYFDAGNFIAALMAKWSPAAPANGSPILSSIKLMLQAITKLLANSPKDAIDLHERVRIESSLHWFFRGLNLRHLARAYLFLRIPEKALEALGEAYLIGRAHYCERVEFGQTLLDLALVEPRGQPGSDLPREAQAHFPQSPHLVRLFEHVGEMLFQEGRLPEAEKLFEESQRLLAFASPSPDLAADILSMLARIYKKTQRPFIAQLEQAQVMYSTTVPSRNIVLSNYIMLGRSYMSEGRLGDVFRVKFEAKKLVFQEVFLQGQHDANKLVSDLFHLHEGRVGFSALNLMLTYYGMDCYDLAESLVTRGMQQSGSWSLGYFRSLYKQR